MIFLLIAIVFVISLMTDDSETPREFYTWHGILFAFGFVAYTFGL